MDMNTSDQNSKKTLMDIFQFVDDPRKPYNQKHCFMDIVAITILASICGADSWNEIELWGNANQEWLSTFLSLYNGIPSHDTFNRLFQLIDPDQLHKAFSDWTASIVSKLNCVISIDGKTIRRSREKSSGLKAAHIVTAWAGAYSMALGQLKTEEKSNEITAIPKLLETLAISGCIVTIDAMGTQRQIAQKIVDLGGDYILPLKDNQQTLRKEVEEYFQEEIFSSDQKGKEGSYGYYETFCKDHGRIEKREYFITSDTGWMVDAKKDWPSIGAIGACRSKVEENGVTSVSERYLIISDAGMSAQTFGDSLRSHWGIENSLHWCLDIAYREDDSRMRAENAAENMNVIRQMTLNMLGQEKSTRVGIKAKRKRCGWDRDYLLRVLGTCCSLG